jgi:hypothetical protein
MNIADYISAFPGATDDDLISAGFAPQAVQAFRTGYMPPPSGDPSKIQPTVMPANTFGDVASQYGNEYISGGMDLAFNPNVSSYDALPQSMQGGFMEPFNREVMSILDLPLGLLSAAGGLGQKAIALGAEAIGSGTQSEERLARDWIGGVEGSGFAPEGRMLAAIADAGGIGAAGRKIAERANQPGPVPTMYSNPIAGLLGDAALMRKTAAELRSEANIQKFGYDPNAGIMAYQGSPHNFPAERLVKMPDGSQQYIVGSPDKLPNVPEGAEVLKDYPMGRMRMDKIGTGEGAQAYGHGLYYAENSDVGRGYRDMGGFEQGTMKVGRQDIQDVYSQLENSAARLPAKQAEDKYNQMALIEDLMNGGDTLHIDQQFNNGAYDQKTYDWFKKNIEPKFQNSKKLYQVQINAKPEDFINFDAPFSEQPQKVQDFYSYLARNKTGPSGDELARRIESPIYAREAKDAGIAGVRYLDEGSRLVGAGTQNYVVFDENLINIVKKYGIAGAATMLGVSAIDVEKALADNVPPSQWDQLVVGPQ